MAIAGDDSAERRSRSGVDGDARNEVQQRLGTVARAVERRPRRCSPMSGMAVLSWNIEVVAPSVMAASRPTTWQQAWMTASGTTGLTLPGMMLDPGWTAGSVISAKTGAAGRSPSTAGRCRS